MKRNTLSERDFMSGKTLMAKRLPDFYTSYRDFEIRSSIKKGVLMKNNYADTERNYKVGQTIVVTEESPDGNYNIHAGDEGVICYVFGNGTYAISVDFGRNIFGHECGGNCDYQCGWNLREGEFVIDTSPDISEEETASDEEMMCFFSGIEVRV